MFESVLIANRGEIAVRIMATCQEMGIRTIAVYSHADVDALHVRRSDVAYPIGGAPALESYLNIPAIIEVARRSGASAIHPGYGFLAENAEFAEACAAADIVFIGPPPEAIRLMGLKTAAKRMVEQAGVPTVPGYSGEQGDLGRMQREAARLGYPVMIKASAGGGGKGMRVVETREDLAVALAAARREALAAFGDDSVFLEKLVVAPRHVEFQILADHYGDTVHLGERECSIQRRHQKIIEESPCTALSQELRDEMGLAAIKAAQSVGYVNAGTCEFLLDDQDRFYFLEMNTRLQVEHPVTELVTGLDLVRLQLAIAAGERLPFHQDDITSRGHAIEARLYAEDPSNNYLPSTGTLSCFQVPQAPGVRVDAGVASGDIISVHYDPMLAKLVVYGANRSAAIERLRWALDRCAVLGVATNLPLLQAIAGDADFLAGNTTTAYLSAHSFPGLVTPPAATPLVLVAAALWETLSRQREGSSAPRPDKGFRPYNPWTHAAVSSGQESRAFRYQHGKGESIVVLTPDRAGEGYAATVNDEPFQPGDSVGASLDSKDVLTLRLGALRRQVVVARRGRELLIHYSGENYTVSKPRPLDVDSVDTVSRQVEGRLTLVAPMAGTLIRVQVKEGETVTANQPLVILGAMKMEHSISAPHAGRIVRVSHAAGDVVPGGETLVELETGTVEQDHQED